MATLRAKLSIIAPLLVGAGLIALCLTVSWWFFIVYASIGVAVSRLLKSDTTTTTENDRASSLPIRVIASDTLWQVLNALIFGVLWLGVVLYACGLCWLRPFTRSNLQQMLLSPLFWTYVQR